MTTADIIIGILGSNVLIAIVSHLLAKRRYKAEIQSLTIDNKGKSDETYQKEIDYLSERLRLTNEELVKYSEKTIDYIHKIEGLTKIIERLENGKGGTVGDILGGR